MSKKYDYMREYKTVRLADARKRDTPASRVLHIMRRDDGRYVTDTLCAKRVNRDTSRPIRTLRDEDLLALATCADCVVEYKRLAILHLASITPAIVNEDGRLRF